MFFVENTTINLHGTRFDPIWNKARRNVERSGRLSVDSSERQL